MTLQPIQPAETAPAISDIRSKIRLRARRFTRDNLEFSRADVEADKAIVALGTQMVAAVAALPRDDLVTRRARELTVAALTDSLAQQVRIGTKIVTAILDGRFQPTLPGLDDVDADKPVPLQEGSDSVKGAKTYVRLNTLDVTVLVDHRLDAIKGDLARLENESKLATRILEANFPDGTTITSPTFVRWYDANVDHSSTPKTAADIIAEDEDIIDADVVDDE